MNEKSKSFKVGIVGSTGYTGVALIELLLKHPHFKIEVLTSESYAGQKFSDIYPGFRGRVDNKLVKSSLNKLKSCDAIFFATPNGIAHKLTPALIKAKKKVVDLSADYRFRDLKTYEKWYGFKRTNKADRELNTETIYGLTEINREEIQEAVENGLSLIGNPGCYTTASILALAPILDFHAASKTDLCDTSSIIIDAKSGVSGAGRKASVATSYSELNESVSPYNLAGAHRHTPELETFFSEFTEEKIELSFSPHLMPMTRGLLATCYININPRAKMNDAKLKAIYTDFYGKTGKGEKFVEILDKGIYPQTKWVVDTNNAIISVHFDKKLNRAIITCAIDNLIKGAGGQAIQNMNLLFGMDDSVGF